MRLGFNEVEQISKHEIWDPMTRVVCFSQNEAFLEQEAGQSDE